MPKRTLLWCWKTLLVVLLAATLGQVNAATMSDSEKSLYAKAQKNSESVTWYISHYSAETAEQIGAAFKAKFPGVTFNVIRTTAQVAFQRLNQDLRAGVQQCDVISTTDLGHYAYLKEKGLLTKFTPEAAAKAFKAYQGLDPDGYFHVTSAGLVVLAYNKEKTAGKTLPKKWADLLDPMWKDEVALGHPGFSGYVGTWVVLMRKLYGWEYFDKLEKNNPQIGRSINDTVTMLNAGERSVAAGPAATTLRSASRGNPLGVIYPEDGSLLMIAPSGILSNSKNPNGQALHGVLARSGNLADCSAGVCRADPSRSAASGRRSTTQRSQDPAPDLRGNQERHPRDQRVLARHLRRLTGLTRSLAAEQMRL
jgi:iron(III) transport system substrate-binding protein